ncbi:MAG: hypothetical protein HRT44_08975, partial [Bdellovibrionales bacterium]|nr:hypothetical protein [Bdellovibrionales bacterium]NQZ19373.1 hypothetical protein [Bdellovibrionales bacterium]
MNILKMATFTLISGCLINCASAPQTQERSLASTQSWISCYEFDDESNVNKLSFYDPAQVSSVRAEGESNCRQSNVHYDGPQGFEMMDGDLEAVEEQISQANNLEEQLNA